ncbi:MAG: SHOCT domain-containing protein [Anaerofustis sp.]
MMFARGFYHMTYGMPGIFHLGEFGALFFGLWILLIVAAVVFAVIMIVRRNKVVSHRSNSAAIEALNLKYASGEITEEEYLKRKEVLRKG